jgi:2-dehydropantoate 2-reductase
MHISFCDTYSWIHNSLTSKCLTFPTPRLLATPDAVFARLGGKMLAMDPLARSSMSDDLAAGRTTEVDWINGEVVHLAERLGQRAPINAQLCAMVHAAESAAARPSWSGNDLLAALGAPS